MNDDDEHEDGLALDDDAYVTALLSALPPVEMPADVRARIEAALVPTAAATVVPMGARASRWRNPRVLQAAAAAVLVVAGTAVVVKATDNSTSAGSTAAGKGVQDQSASGAEAAATASGTAYTAATLDAQVRALVARRATFSGSGSSSGGADSTGTKVPGGVPRPQAPSTRPLDAHAYTLAHDVNLLAKCITALEAGIAYTQPLAIDAGTYAGQPALVVVLPDPGSPTTYGVWIVKPTCGQGNDAHLVAYQVVPRN